MIAAPSAKRPARAKKAPVQSAPVPVECVSRTEGGFVITTIAFALRLVSEANAREHHHVKAKRAKEQRELTRMVLNRYVGRPMHVPTRVTITRIARGLLDSDNLAGSGKHVRDEVAAWAGVSDAPSGGVAWAVLQEKAKVYATRIEIVRRA